MSETGKAAGVPRWIQILIWAMLVGLLAIVGWRLKDAQNPMAATGERIPELSFTFFEGYEHAGRSQMKLSDLRGQVVILNVWASWCKPCEQEAPELEAAWQQFKDQGVVLIGVDYVDTPSGALAYLRKFKITFPNAPDLKSSISSILNQNMGVPETYFIDRNGVLQYVQIGPFASVNEIQAILAEKIDPAFAP